jgi:hypothetical protein
VFARAVSAEQSDDLRNTARSYFLYPRVLVLVHAPHAEVMHGARWHFLTFARKYLSTLTLKRRIWNAQGRPLFEVYAILDPHDRIAVTHGSLETGSLSEPGRVHL